ncbi:unnamed protein product, partial [marine sediment metagenome]
MKKKRNKRYSDLIVNNLGAITMFIILILVSSQVITRYVFKYPLSWSEELARYFLIWLVMIGAVTGLSNKEHIKIETFVHLLSSKSQKLFYLFSDLIIIFVLS